MSRTIKVTIPLKGLSKGERHVQVETSGFTGTACKDATLAFEAALGKTQHEELKNEFYQTEGAIEKVNLGGE